MRKRSTNKYVFSIDFFASCNVYRAILRFFNLGMVLEKRCIIRNEIENKFLATF